MKNVKKIDLLDYENCIANLPNSVLKHFGAKTVGDTLPLADKYLEKNYKNVVIHLLDGMGTYILENNLQRDGFFRTHLVDSYKTVFPPTTVAATTSIDCGLQPIEHAWFGWECYYPQIDENVTVFLNTKPGTKQSVASESVARKYCGYASLYHMLNDQGHQAHYATPFIPPYLNSIEGICDRVVDLCRLDGDKYIYAYWHEPDLTMHKYGCYADETKAILKSVEETVQKMCEKLEDTLLIITADHGHVDGRNVCIADYPEVTECLVRSPSIEPRALNLFVKEGRKEDFEKAFEKAFGQDFLLLTKQEVYDLNIFGTGKKHANADAMLGDYVGIAVSDLTVFNENDREEATKFKGVHAGLTREEMTIPFIVVEKQ